MNARWLRLHAPLLAVAVAGTATLTVALLREPRLTRMVVMAAAFVGLLAFAALRRRDLSTVSLRRALGWLALFLPLAALVGPVLAPPGLPQLFAFRLLLGAAALLVVLLVITGGTRPWQFPHYLLLFGLWFAWLSVTLIWATDRQAGLRYLFIIGSMMALTAATAYGGTSARHLRILTTTLAVAFGLTVLVALLEALVGLRLPTSALAGVTGARELGVTSFYFNQNNLATFLTICWPFLLGVFLVTRRLAWRLAGLLAIAVALFVFLRTGSRSSLVVIGLETLAMAPLLLRLASRQTARVAAALGVLVVAGLVWLAFNTSEHPVLRQFRLATLLESVEQGFGSGETRFELTRVGLSISARSYFLGVGPGNAEVKVKEATGDPDTLGNLHDWWLEVLVNGGLPALALYLLLYFGLTGAMYGVARRARDRLTRYLAVGTLVALLGYVIGSLGPSTAVGFAPMWVLFGLGLAVIVRAESLAREPGALVRDPARLLAMARPGAMDRPATAEESA